MSNQAIVSKLLKAVSKRRNNCAYYNRVLVHNGFAWTGSGGDVYARSTLTSVAPGVYEINKDLSLSPAPEVFDGHPCVEVAKTAPFRMQSRYVGPDGMLLRVNANTPNRVATGFGQYATYSMPVPENDAPVCVKIDLAELHWVAKASSDDDSREPLVGVSILTDLMVATDGRRLHISKHPLQERALGEGGRGYILPTAFIELLPKKGEIILDLFPDYVRTVIQDETGYVWLWHKLEISLFPDFWQVLPHPESVQEMLDGQFVATYAAVSKGWAGKAVPTVRLSTEDCLPNSLALVEASYQRRVIIMPMMKDMSSPACEFDVSFVADSGIGPGTMFAQQGTRGPATFYYNPLVKKVEKKIDHLAAIAKAVRAALADGTDTLTISNHVGKLLVQQEGFFKV